MYKAFLLLVLVPLTISCSATHQEPGSYPKSREEKLDERIGKLGGGDGISIFGGKSSSATKGINVNSYIWKASLDIIYFMPIIAADPFGGTILTDWYTSEKDSEHRYKVNIFIIGTYLRSDAIKVAVFRQKKDGKGQWIDDGGAQKVASEIEEKILYRARQIKFTHLK